MKKVNLTLDGKQLTGLQKLINQQIRVPNMRNIGIENLYELQLIVQAGKIRLKKKGEINE